MRRTRFVRPLLRDGLLAVKTPLAALLVVALPLLASTPAAASLVFTPGDLVVSIVGNGDGSGNYTDNQASPVVLQQLTTTGAKAGSLVLPQTTVTVNGVVQYAVSGEYGSSSEGLLHRSADGASLVIAGYGVNAATYNRGGAAVYGDARLAQSTSIRGGAFMAVPRVIASITAGGGIDSSTGLYNVFNGNNPRSVATVDGSRFYIAGQGSGNSDTATQGVFYAQKGASTATQITGVSNYRSVNIENGQLYASRDYNGAGGAQAAEIDGFATSLPTATSAPTALKGIGPTITVDASSNNVINTTRSGTTVYLSPEDYFLTPDGQYLYIADSGNPKNGNAGKAALGDGGLQKWKLVGNTWTLQYDIFAGLGLVANTAASGTTGLIGLAGQVIDGVAFLYATNATVGDLDPTFLFTASDPLAQTGRGATAGSDLFSVLYTPPAGSNVRGVAFAPVSEPASISLVLVGLAVVVGQRRRKRAD